jgi:hypothetical protein
MPRTISNAYVRPVRLRSALTAVAGSAVVLIALGGCSTGRDTSSEPVDDGPVAEVEATPSEEPTPEPPAFTYPTDTYSAAYEDQNGFKQTITVSIGPVIPGSDTDKLAAAWARVGGAEGSTPPCMNVHPTGTGNTNFVLKSDFAGYALGTVQLTNDVTDFDPKAWTYQFFGLQWDGSAMGIAYSSGAKCSDLHGGLLVRPAWKSNQWGPVPVAIAVNEYLSPAHPQGDPAKIEKPMNVRTFEASTQQPISFTLKALPAT